MLAVSHSTNGESGESTFAFSATGTSPARRFQKPHLSGYQTT